MLLPDYAIDGDTLVFLNSIYDIDTNDLYLKFYNTRNNRLYRLRDGTCFKPFFYVREKEFAGSQGERDLNTSNSSFFEIQRKEMYDGINDEMVGVLKFMPSFAGGKPTQSPILSGIELFEDKIKVHESYALSSQLVPCALYHYSNNTLYENMPELDEKQTETLERMTKPITDDAEYSEYLHFYTYLLSQPVPFLRRCAIDIEVRNKDNKFPSLELHDDPIIAISFYSNDGFEKTLVLDDGSISGPGSGRLDPFIERCVTEPDLIKRAFELINGFPIVLTFNGDDFDLAYLSMRSKSFSVEEMDPGANPNPIIFSLGDTRKRNSFLKDPALLRQSIHLDLFRLFKNVSLYNYGFNRKYASFGLDAVARALVGEGKTPMPEGRDINSLDMGELCRYCLKDAEITLRLTTYSNDLVMKLLFTISRITKAPMEDVDRYGISNWARSMLYFEHRKKDVLIPNRDNLIVKGEGSTKSIIEGKKFKGAYVMEPKPGTYFNVTCMDFGSLYPSIIKSSNISYETINCSHADCKQNNPVEDTNHWICGKRKGMLSRIIGVIRDLRISYFKKLSKDKSLSQDDLDLYDAIAQASKVILNGSYGVVGSEAFNLFCLPVAESVTAKGRSIIMSTIKYAESIGVKVIYSDTDSVFCYNPTKDNIDKMVQFAKQQYSIDLEVDKKYRYIIFSDRKKNYFGIHESGFVDTKGLTGKKSNIPRYIRNCFYSMGLILKTVTDEQDLQVKLEEVKELVRKYIRDLRNRDYEIADLAFNSLVNRKLDDYGEKVTGKKDLWGMDVVTYKSVPMHIKIAKELRDQGNLEIGEKSFISYIKTISGPKLVSQISRGRGEVDVEKYIDTFKTSLEPVLETLNINFDDLISNTKKQVTLDSMFFK